MRSLLGSALVVALIAPTSAQTSVTSADAAIINEVLRVTALEDIAKFAKPGAPPVLLVVNQTVAACAAMPAKSYCLDATFRTLDIIHQRGGWPPPTLLSALRERNRARAPLSDLPLATGGLVPHGERGSQGRCVAQVSLPAIIGDDALVITVSQLAGSQVRAVQLRRTGDFWKAIHVEHLMSGG